MFITLSFSFNQEKNPMPSLKSSLLTVYPLYLMMLTLKLLCIRDDFLDLEGLKASLESKEI